MRIANSDERLQRVDHILDGVLDIAVYKFIFVMLFFLVVFFPCHTHFGSLHGHVCGHMLPEDSHAFSPII